MFNDTIGHLLVSRLKVHCIAFSVLFAMILTLAAELYGQLSAKRDDAPIKSHGKSDPAQVQLG